MSSVPKIPGTLIPQSVFLDSLRQRVASVFVPEPAASPSSSSPSPAQKDSIAARPSTIAWKRFPGAQPVSLTRAHMTETLMSRNFFVSEKADGVRVLVYTCLHSPLADNLLAPITSAEGGHPLPPIPHVYLIDRKNDYYLLPHFYLSAKVGPQLDTLLDAELIWDGDASSPHRKLWLYLFDCLSVCGKRLVSRPYTKRLGHLKEDVLKPYREYYKRVPEYRRLVPFEIFLKPLQSSYHLANVLKECRRLKHGFDGLIFTDCDAPYVHGTNQHMLKWKSSEENTVDFRLTYREEPDTPTQKSEEHPSSTDTTPPPSKYSISLMVGGSEGHRVLSPFLPTPDIASDWDTSPPGQGRILECKYTEAWPYHWQFSRYRDDKDSANHIDVYKLIMQSIEDNVTEEELIQAAPAMKERWKERLAQAEVNAGEKASAIPP